MDSKFNGIVKNKIKITYCVESFRADPNTIKGYFEKIGGECKVADKLKKVRASQCYVVTVFLPLNFKLDESRRMNKKLIRLTESDLHRIIKESAKKVISEISWQKSDSAVGKSEYFDWSSDVLKDIKEIRDYLENYASNDDDWFNSQEVGSTSWQGSSTGSGQAKKMLSYLDMIEKFVLRKQKQASNLAYLNDDNFKTHHNGMSRREFEDTIPDNYEDDGAQLTDSQKEFINRKW
jgi:hypothetical protein